MINWDLFLAVLGAIIALSASIATIWQGVLTRKHNKLTVRPMLRTEGSFVSDQPMSIILSNTGFGPAIIKSVQLLVDEKEITNKNNQIYEKALELTGLSHVTMKHFTLFPQDTFSPGESRYLLETRDPITNKNLEQQIKQSFSRLTFKIKYVSIYGDEFDLMNTHSIKS